MMRIMWPAVVDTTPMHLHHIRVPSGTLDVDGYPMPAHHSRYTHPVLYRVEDEVAHCVSSSNGDVASGTVTHMVYAITLSTSSTDGIHYTNEDDEIAGQEVVGPAITSTSWCRGTHLSY